MKNLLLLLSCFLFGMHGFAQGETTPQTPTSVGEFEILPFTLNAGETKEIHVRLHNTKEKDLFVQAQFDLFLPEGISLASNRGKYVLSDEISWQHQLEGKFQDAQKKHYRATIISTGNTPFCTEQIYNAAWDANPEATSPNPEIMKLMPFQEGNIAKLKVKGDANLAAGTYEIQIKNVVLSRNGLDHNISVKDLPADYTTSVISGTPSAPNIVLKGHFTPEVATTVNGALTSDAITTVDLSQAKIDASTTFTTGNPNTLYYVAEGVNLANTNNVVVGNTCANLNLVDGKNFSVLNDFTAQQATYARNIANEGWYSVCLPFAAEIPSNTIVEEFATYNAATNSVQFNNVTTMSAGNAYIFKAAVPTTFSATNVLVSDITKKVVGADSFNGTFTNMAAGSVTGKYALHNDGSGFGTCTATAFVPAFHAYLDVPAKSQSIKLNHDGVTAIEGVEAEEINFPSDIYTLDGKLVKKQAKDLNGMPKGVYVINNTKVIK